MPHGFTANVGTTKAAVQALDAFATFLVEKLAATSGGRADTR